MRDKPLSCLLAIVIVLAIVGLIGLIQVALGNARF